jgi:hypothetical protein
MSHHYFILPVRNLANDTDLNCTGNPVQSGIVPTTSGGPRICLANTVFQQASYIAILVLILWPIPHSICHLLLSCNKHFLCDVHVHRAPEQLA